MINVTVLYPNKPGCRFDWKHYLDVHMPLCRKVLGNALKSVKIEKGLSAPMSGGAAEYIAVCQLGFESQEAFLAEFAIHGETLTNDIPNYTDLQPVIQISEIVCA